MLNQRGVLAVLNDFVSGKDVKVKNQPMTGDEPKDNAKTIEEKLIYLKRLRRNALNQDLPQAAQFIGSHIWGIIFVMEQLFPPEKTPEKTPEDTPFVFESDGKQYITIGKVKYPVELDETRSPGEWYIRGKADDSR